MPSNVNFATSYIALMTPKFVIVNMFCAIIAMLQNAVSAIPDATYALSVILGLGVQLAKMRFANTVDQVICESICYSNSAILHLS